jgi:PilZ domain-containing protein
MNANSRKGPLRVEFVSPRPAQIVAADRTWRRDCRMIDVSDTGAQLEMAFPEEVIDEFFLLLSSVGKPAFRRCKVVWAKGVRLRVTFDKKKLSAKLLEESPPSWG